MTRKVVVLAGAPLAAKLDWTPSTLLDDAHGPAAFLAGEAVASRSRPDRRPAAWRSLPLHPTRLPTGFSQVHGFALDESPHFFTTGTATSSQDDTKESLDQDELISQLYDQSLALNEGDISQQVLGASLADPITSFLSNTSDGNGSTSASLQDNLSSSGHRQPHPPRAPVGNASASWHLSDLEDIPPASYLTSIAPQTVTVNLIVGLISIPAPRTVQTRWGSEVALVELLVGDDTRSGFAVTFWLASEPARRMVTALRRQDVVLLQGVALSVFRGRVYGQSVRRDGTKVHLLYRRKLDDDDVGGHYSRANLRAVDGEELHPQLEKTRRVAEWVLAFVGQAAEMRREGRAVRSWDKPPEDTQ